MSSQYLTIGTRDVNGTDAAFVGTAKLVVLPGDPATVADEADAQMSVQITDVRRKQAMNDYTGELRTRVSTRITDRVGSRPTSPRPRRTRSFT